MLKDITFVVMRIKGTKYEPIDQLPETAKPVSKYATENNTAVGYIYIKYKRYLDGETTTNPGYTIRCYLGMNFVIPNNQ
jgi:hypothetical protein